MPNDAAENNPPNDKFAATQLFNPEESISRQEEDIALAAELLNSGYVNERELSAAVSNWSMHGSVSLAQHLEDKQVLTSDLMSRVQQSATDRISRARKSIAGGSEAPAADQSMLLATLERLDGSGRVAKLFGVTVAARSGDHDSRVMEGRYELIRKIGQGGLGRVWLARDANLNRHVALKEISHASTSNSRTVERFKKEAEITGRLDHPSIVPIYQLGEDLATERVFYTMRFLGRSTLQDSINEYHERRQAGDEDPMLLRHLLTAFVNVCHAIGHAHSRKVIHRDLKPENVVIDSFGQVIVIDWGLAKVIDDTSVESLMDSVATGSVERTMEGQVMGTPLYMAPEQAAGRLDELDHRTDIYGLGAILFSIVTGYAPHEKTQKRAVEQGSGSAGMISTIANGVTPLASELNSSADPALEAICWKAMSRRRYARYQEAVDLAEDVQRWMAGEPVTAYSETHWQRVNRWIGQHQRLSQLLMAGVMIALVALTTLGMSARHNHLVNLRNRYAQMAGDVGEIELQLRGVGAELSKDVRFLAALPPIQGIIQARNGTEADSEEVWRERLETIYSGMLRSNPEYLSLSYEEIDEDGTQDIVRVERNPADPSLVRVLPISRLLKVDSDHLSESIKTLEPGDIRLSLDPRTRHKQNSKSTNRLAISTPVFSDETGECFGMTVIETDLSYRLKQILLAQGSFEYEMYVADGSGILWVFADPEQGVQLARDNQTIPGLPEPISVKLQQAGDAFSVESKDEYIAERFYVDPQGRGVTLFARMVEGE